MPAENQTTDYRPYGAAGGAALPTLGVLEYLLKTRPELLRKMKDAPDWTLANGDIDVARALRELKPGDFGVSGLQRTADRGVNFLVGGSAIASGGPGAHGQVVGKNLQIPPEWFGLADDASMPDMPFLMNERGELYNPTYARNYDRLHDIRERYNLWDNYEKARAAGKTAPEPAMPKPTDKEMAFFRDELTNIEARKPPADIENAMGYGHRKELLRRRSQLLGRLRQKERAGTLTPAQKKQLKGVTRRRDFDLRDFRRFLNTPKLRRFFEDQPAARATANFVAIQSMADEMAGVPKQAAKERVSRLSELSKKFKGQGNARSKQIAKMIERAVKKPPAPPTARSTVFKPKAFERFIPTLHHGGSQGNAGDPVLHGLKEFAEEAVSAVKNRRGLNISGLRKSLADIMQSMEADRAWLASNPEAHLRPRMKRPGIDGPRKVIDNVFGATAQDGSRMLPAEIPATATYGPGGPRATLWARWRNGVNMPAFNQSLAKNVAESYAGTAATGAGAKEILGINALRRFLPNISMPRASGSKCVGNHCGSMPARVFADAGSYKPKVPFADTLPSMLLSDPNVEIIGIANKTRALKDFARLGRSRVAAGLGAAGIMGALGYGATHLAGGKPRPIAPPKPVYDPRLVQAVKTLFPKHTQRTA